MRFIHSGTHLLPAITLGVSLAALCALASVGLAQHAHLISQKGRQFHPNELTVQRGDAVEIINDDADLRHHAYIKSDTFNFDSGDQEPGSKTDIVFSTSGDFDVLCAIHPKMKLTVHVK